MSDKTSDRLLPCPFCGGEAWLREHTALNGETNYYVECGYIECGVSPETSIFVTSEEAINAWNTRKPMKRIMERLEEVYDVTHENYMKDRDLITLGRKYGLEHAIEILKEEGEIE